MEPVIRNIMNHTLDDRSVLISEDNIRYITLTELMWMVSPSPTHKMMK